ncbi:hypothetical protein AURDEDRAFT_71747 [Auricularia subglabra TFB-10046 SS5]|nr:hypothetical protein AURDEDRAFT_71747 [Auricularia subglabra TFB-10046 SS5]
MLHLTVAPWMVGCFLDLFTQGILVCQFRNYFAWYKDDKALLRGAVMWLVLLTTLKLFDSCAAVWIAQVEYFGDLQGAILLSYVAWWQSGVPLMGATMDFYVQCYFLYRLVAISKRHWVVYPVAVFILFAFLTSNIGVRVFAYLPSAASLTCPLTVAAHLGSAFAADLIMSISTAHFLLQSRKHSLRQTHGLIDMLVRLTWQSAAPSAACALANLIMSQLDGDFLTATIPNMLLPKLYSIAMMWTINSRKDIRLVNASGKTSSSEGVSATGRVGRTTRVSCLLAVFSRAPRGSPLIAQGNDLELGRLGATIQIHKDTQTIQRVDVSHV